MKTDRRGFLGALLAAPLALAVRPKPALMFHRDAFAIAMAPLQTPEWVQREALIQYGRAIQVGREVMAIEAVHGRTITVRRGLAE